MNAMTTVLIVPGIAGSELYTSSLPYTFLRGTLWLNIAGIAAGGWEWLRLASDGVSPPGLLYPTIASGRPLHQYYDILALELGKAGYRADWPFQDWRQVTTMDAARLVNYIRANRRQWPLHIVAHSRGGLVARAAIATLEAAGELNAIGRVVGLGVPHQGAWEAASLLAGWNDNVTLLYRVAFAVAIYSPIVAPPAALLAVVRSWPSAYELLPRPGALWTRQTDTDRAYDPAWWADGGAPVSPTWLAAARQRWEDLPTLTAGVSWVNVVGYGQPTPVALTDLPIRRYGSLAVADVGDGVVPEESARLAGRYTVRVPVAHGALPYDGRALAAMFAALRGEVTSDQTVS